MIEHSPDDPFWLDVALREMRRGVKEVPGAGVNPRIAVYHKITRAGLTSGGDEVPWCSSFVSWCLEESGITSTRSKAARSYLNWGKPLDKPVRGCIVVTSRGVDIHSGHVGFYVEPRGEDKFLMLGGNQSNAVTIKVAESSRVVGYRWPVVS